MGVIGWSGKMILKFASQRGEMVVLHVLSDDVPREYASLVEEVKKHKIYNETFFVRGCVRDAIAHLVSQKRITIDNGKYARTKADEDDDAKA